MADLEVSFDLTNVTCETEITNRIGNPAIIEDSNAINQTTTSEIVEREGEETEKLKSDSIDNQPHNARFQKQGQKYVMISFNLINWQFMNFTQKFPDNTRIFTIKVETISQLY